MNDLQYLFAGFAVFWAGLTCYVVWLQVRLRTLKREGFSHVFVLDSVEAFFA